MILAPSVQRCSCVGEIKDKHCSNSTFPLGLGFSGISREESPTICFLSFADALSSSNTLLNFFNSKNHSTVTLQKNLAFFGRGRAYLDFCDSTARWCPLRIW